jgi:deoxyadenosine/deoxycytidine kinase
MENPFQQYPFIAIEGNIGSGKTTFCHKMAEHFECNIILEQFTDNPFLPFFYQQPERYAFPVELFFMTERHKQLQEHFASPNLFQQSVASDYFFVKTLLFAKNNLNDEEFRLFQRLFGVLNNTFPKPDLLVYLHRPIDALLRQIRQRGRDMEQNIAPEYLEEIQNAYLEFFKSENSLPILVIELGDLDFQRDQTVMNAIVGLVNKSYPNGLNLARL